MNVVTYCMNVHPGESLDAVRKALADVTLPLQLALGPESSHAVGLRLGAQAAEDLRVPEHLERFASYLRRERLTVLGINGFPYGDFHAGRVKEDAYLPDWGDARRMGYTRDLFYALSKLPLTDLGEGHAPGVTTVPLAYDRGQNIEDYFEAICAIGLFLRKLEGFTGIHMQLALEPEPDCLLESVRTTVDFFERLWTCPHWNPLCRDHIALCFDTCHFAVSYEDPLTALKTLVGSRIPIARVQISAALEVTSEAKPEDLRPFLDPTYMHQTRLRNPDGTLQCHPDLTETVLPELIGRGGRVHYHVPLSWDGTAALRSTRDTLTPAFWRYLRAGGWPLEIETYAHFVMPETIRTHTLSEMLLRDIRWTLSNLRTA